MPDFQRATSSDPEPSTDPGSTSSSSRGVSSGPAHFSRETRATTLSYAYSSSSGLTSTVLSSTPSRGHLRYYTTSHSPNPLLNPDTSSGHPLLTAHHLESLNQCRLSALSSITVCHNMITTLELSRITASRVGSATWFSFWDSLYTHETLQVITSFVNQARRRIDSLFNKTATRLHTMLNLIHTSVRFAATAAQIIWELEIIEEHAYWEREHRRRKAARILEKMRAHIQNATYLVIDEDKLTDMKRGIFSLDLLCDYYPHTLADGHTAVVLPVGEPESTPFLQYDPSLDPRSGTVLIHNARHYRVAPGFRPTGNYYLDTTRLV